MGKQLTGCELKSIQIPGTNNIFRPILQILREHRVIEDAIDDLVAPAHESSVPSICI